MNWYKKAQIREPEISPSLKEETLFHGTNEEFDTFETERESVNIGMLGSESPAIRHAVFFAKNKEFAKEFGKNIKEISTKLLNTFDFESKKNNFIFVEFYNLIKNDGEIMRELNDGSFQDWGYFDNIVGEKFVPFLKSKGFNSASFLDTGVEGQTEETIAIFDTNAISQLLQKKIR